jgi:tetratricopeptide (TPR) repeat protein
MNKSNQNLLKPTEQQLNSLLKYYQAGQYVDAKKLSLSITKEFPEHQFAWNVLGAVLKQMGKINESLVAFKKSVQLNSHDANAHYNLGTVLRRLGKLEESEESYKRAISLKSDFSEAYYNSGLTLQILEKFDEAEARFKKAIVLKSDFASAHYSLGNNLKIKKKFEEAVTSYRDTIMFKPNHAPAYNNLGITFKILGRNNEAQTSYRKAIEIKPDYADAYNNLGGLLIELNKFEEAETCCRKSIELKPDYAEAYYNLGNVLAKLNRLDEAILSYDKALEFKSNYKSALLNRGHILFKKGEHKLSLSDFDKCNTEDSRFRALVSLYALDRIDEIYTRIKNQSELDDKNIRVAAFSSFISFKTKKDTKHNFCKNPIELINISNISKYIENSNLFISEVITELKNIKTMWEPLGKSTIKGFQSSELFQNPTKNLKDLKMIIMNEIRSYKSKFNNENCSFIKKWPKSEKLACWHVILKQLGYQGPHIHPGGWLSGVFYLKVTPDLGKNQGAIEFSLNGQHYRDINSAKSTYQPTIGDIVLFPSSLHHRTIPFKTNMDRISIAFDLIP